MIYITKRKAISITYALVKDDLVTTPLNASNIFLFVEQILSLTDLMIHHAFSLLVGDMLSVISYIEFIACLLNVIMEMENTSVGCSCCIFLLPYILHTNYLLGSELVRHSACFLMLWCCICSYPGNTNLRSCAACDDGGAIN